MENIWSNRFIPIAKPSFLLTILFTLLMVILQGFGEVAISLFRYENTMIQTSEWWRLLSGHFIHLSWAHLMLNLTGLWLVFIIFFQFEKPVILLTSIIMLAIGISLELAIFSHDITWYVGLSGVLHGLIVIGAMKNYRFNPWIAISLLVGISAKLAWEQFFADAHAMELAIGGKVIYEAHLYGVITGIFIATFFKIMPIPNHSIEKQSE